jgi:hypothetical protein
MLHTAVVARTAVLVSVLLLPLAQAHAGTYPVADTSLYKLNGGDEPVFGYKIAGPGKDNFMSCRKELMQVDASRLSATSGSCGDTKGGGLVVFTLKASGYKTATLTVVESAEFASGQTFELSTAALNQTEATKSAASGKSSKPWVTTDGGAIAAIAASSRNAGYAPNASGSVN